jgi:hypothetical protein
MSHVTRLGGALALLAAVLGAPAVARGETPPALGDAAWVAVAPGIEFCRVETQGLPRGGRIAALRLDPGRCRIEPYHERDFPGDDAATADDWTRRLGAPVVFNAGLYREDRVHLGTLRRGGVDVGGSRHRSYMGLLVSGPLDRGLPDAAVLDLSTPDGRRLAPRYANAVQSMMLFDSEGVIRVRRTDRSAPRTVVAADRRGRLIVLVTEGSHTLWSLAELLLGSSWDLASAMALDGGREADLCVETSSLRYRTREAEEEGDAGSYFRGTVTLPAVIAVWPKRPDS